MTTTTMAQTAVTSGPISGDSIARHRRRRRSTSKWSGHIGAGAGGSFPTVAEANNKSHSVLMFWLAPLGRQSR